MRVAQYLETSWRSQGLNISIDDLNHGDLPRWLEAIDLLPNSAPTHVSLGNIVTIGDAREINDNDVFDRCIQTLAPWRKGPFRLFGRPINSEWRSDLKWERVRSHIDLHGRSVLDVGCGNGYYGWRMLEAGASSVTGIDSSLLFVLQHALFAQYMGNQQAILPLRLEEFSAQRLYDVVFSMGVLYHQTNPEAHLDAVCKLLSPDGTLILETLVYPTTLVPNERYARMKNVHIPSIADLCHDLEALGFNDVDVKNVSLTRTLEQRSTDNMPFESLAKALSDQNALETVEGYRAPVRATIIAVRI